MSIRGTRDRRLISKGIIDSEPAQAVQFPPVGPKAKIVTRQPVVEVGEGKAAVSVAPPITRAVEATACSATEYLRIIHSMSPAEIAAEGSNPDRLLILLCHKRWLKFRRVATA